MTVLLLPGFFLTVGVVRTPAFEPRNKKEVLNMRNKVINGRLCVEVFCKYHRDAKSGKVIYAKPGKVFHFWVPVDKSA